MSLEQIAADYEKYYKELEEEAKAVVFEEFKKIFVKYPHLTAIKWSQYTPYFNDGDECTFGVNDFCITNVEDIETELDGISFPDDETANMESTLITFLEIGRESCMERL